MGGLQKEEAEEDDVEVEEEGGQEKVKVVKPEVPGAGSTDRCRFHK